MTNEQHRRVRDLFEAAIDRDLADARAWVAREAADDAVVMDEVLSLLEHHHRTGSFLTHPIVETLPDLFAEEALSPGASVGPYIIVREIGRGGMGRVYLATDTRLNRTVALKALAPHLVRNDAHRERLRREARAAAALAHPGICTVYALEEVDGELYIATEFIDGHTLREEIASGRRPSANDVIADARALASALAEAHRRGVIHRDLKPENVMRTRDGRVKILDFGLALITEVERGAGAAAAAGRSPIAHATQPGFLVGTPAYMSPEQINGQRVDARADVFALGVLLYEYACGTHPFEGSTPLATVARVLDSDARPIANRCPELAGGVADVIGRCLRKAPDARYASAAAVLEALDGAVDARPVTAEHRTWWRVHQLVVSVLYIVAAALAWQIKAWDENPLTVSLFLALGAGATIGCVIRGHLLFTDHFNRAHLGGERRRTARPRLLLDLLFASILFVDAIVISRLRALPAVCALSLALGIALAGVLLEPATSAAAFGDEEDRPPC